MLGVFIVPTGIGAEIGGHAGDATPAARLIAECCNQLIVHPNVVNASDINEMTDNMLYVEGSILDQFMEGVHNLKQCGTNSILVAANAPVAEETINAVSAARATLGIRVQIVELETELYMRGTIKDRKATGKVEGWLSLVEQVRDMDFTALAIHSKIDVPREDALRYFRSGGINPWGGVEAKASRLIASAINKPVAHAPLENVDDDDKELLEIYKEKIDPRMCAEAVSSCYLHCVLKGLHKAPRIVQEGGISKWDIDFMITPDNCFGRPHTACLAAGIPIIIVRENKAYGNYRVPEELGIFVDTYIEAAGWIMAKRAGVSVESVRRPIPDTIIMGKGVKV